MAVSAVAIAIYMNLSGRAVEHPGSICLPTGSSFGVLLDSLGGDGEHLRKIAPFRRAARLSGLDKRVKPGRYILKEGMSYREAAQMFRRGLQIPVQLTFNNIRTLDNLAGALARQVEPDSASLAALLADPATAESYGFTPQTFMAMFVPNTYEVYWNISAAALLDRMHKEYGRFWNADRLAKLEKTGLTQTGVSTLASIVYEETKIPDEMPSVAGVYMNRLRIGMPLQADPTVKFAVGDPSIRRVLNVHLAVDSPYNTYMYKGLPPGPICMPSIKALDAVLNYGKHNYLYFCASPDFNGRHRFAVTLAEHARNAREYANALNRAGIR